LGAGCLVQFNGAGTSGRTAAFFKSVDSGVTWLQKSNLTSVTGGKTIANQSIKSLIMDPDDSKAIYALAAEGGVYYTYDARKAGTKSPRSETRPSAPFWSTTATSACFCRYRKQGAKKH